MAKGTRGGQRGSTTGIGSSGGTIGITSGGSSANGVQNVQIDDTMVASPFSADYDSFMAMSDDDKADFISNAISQGVPDHLANNDLQKFIYNSNLNDKPDVVDDATLDKMKGTELFRTVNNVYDPQHDISYNADQIAKQTMSGTYTRVSDNGGSAYGRGIYFADDRSHSVNTYGNTRGNIKATAVIRAKINNNAKIISTYKATQGANSEMYKGTKLGKVLRQCDYHSQRSIYAMAKGYNIMTNDNGYYVVLNRNAITVSSKVTPK